MATLSLAEEELVTAVSRPWNLDMWWRVTVRENLPQLDLVNLFSTVWLERLQISISMLYMIDIYAMIILCIRDMKGMIVQLFASISVDWLWNHIFIHKKLCQSRWYLGASSLSAFNIECSIYFVRHFHWTLFQCLTTTNFEGFQFLQTQHVHDEKNALDLVFDVVVSNIFDSHRS